MKSATLIGPDVTNGAEPDIVAGVPYIFEFTARGIADLLFHGWNCEAIAEKAAAAKGSKAKKGDNIESYVYRDEHGVLAIPCENMRQAMIGAAKSRQDPRSPRKSLRDLASAAITCHERYAPLGRTTWDYEHRCRVQVQRNGVTRCRPAMLKGWEATFTFCVTQPQYISPELMHDLAVYAGMFVGVCDFRPSYGKFQVVRSGVKALE
jgi:hypothetical protein